MVFLALLVSHGIVGSVGIVGFIGSNTHTRVALPPRTPHANHWLMVGVLTIMTKAPNTKNNIFGRGGAASL